VEATELVLGRHEWHSRFVGCAIRSQKILLTYTESSGSYLTKWSRKYTEQILVFTGCGRTKI